MNIQKIHSLAQGLVGENPGELAPIMIYNTPISPTLLHDYTADGFHVSLGQVYSGNDGGVLLNTSTASNAISFRNTAQFTVYPKRPDGRQCWIFMTADGANYEEFEGHLIMKTNMGPLYFGERGLEYEGNKFLFIIDDTIQATTDGQPPYFTIEYLRKSELTDHQWDFHSMEIEYRKFGA